jgi:hypothetical protein
MILKKGSKGKDTEELQTALNALGYSCGTADGIFGKMTDYQVELFQEDSDLFSDGIVGKGTLRALNEALEAKDFSDLKFKIGDKPDPHEPEEKCRWVRVPADKVEGSKGYNRFTLRADAALAYEALREEVLSLGGVISSAGGKRFLSDSKKSASRSTKSMHYVGLAFDMALDSAMNNPKKERYAIEAVGDHRWNVWCKTDNPTVPEREIEAYTYHHKRIPVKGRYFSFTELAKKHGFEPIRARSWFMRGGKYTGAEWWHFQYNRALTKGKSTFGEELLKLYSLEECKKFAHWEDAKSCVFGENWY